MGLKDGTERVSKSLVLFSQVVGTWVFVSLLFFKMVMYYILIYRYNVVHANHLFSFKNTDPKQLEPFF